MKRPVLTCMWLHPDQHFLRNFLKFSKKLIVLKIWENLRKSEKNFKKSKKNLKKYDLISWQHEAGSIDADEVASMWPLGGCRSSSLASCVFILQRIRLRHRVFLHRVYVYTQPETEPDWASSPQEHKQILFKPKMNSVLGRLVPQGEILDYPRLVLSALWLVWSLDRIDTKGQE